MEIEVIKKLIKRHVPGHGKMIRDAQIAERYYENKNDILYTEKEGDKDTENPLRNADNRIPHNFYGLLVNQKSSYLFTTPPTFDIGENAQNKAISGIIGDAFPKSCKDLCINASNTGMAWLHVWEKENKLLYGVVDSKEVIPIWSPDLNKTLEAVLRVYTNTDENGKLFEVYEYWTDNTCYAYSKEISDSLEAVFVPYNMFSISCGDGTYDFTNVFEHAFEEVPFIPFFNNGIKKNDLNSVKKLIDTYDKVFSGFVNDLEDIQEIILVLSGYEGTELKEFLRDLKMYKTIKVDADKESNGGLQTLTIDIPVEAREKLLTITRKAIFEQGQGVDPDPSNFGNVSGVALKYLYSLLELKSGLLETEFRLGFARFIRIICGYLGIELQRVIQTWTRTSITNDTELADIATKSLGVISESTILKNHPWVDDPESEQKQLEAERETGKEDFEPYKNLSGEPNGNKE